MVRLHTLSSWLPKHKGFARRYARESWSSSDVRGHIVYITNCAKENTKNLIPNDGFD